ncbi:MAG: hypothetical protein PHF88_02040 [Candidatus Pacebacteria bacterium]|nr:hypothetical protein [Candidatus Paceibacterota bacterium]
MLADFSKPNVVIVEKPPDPRVERGKCSEESYLKELDSLESVLWEIRQDLMWTSLKVHQFLLDDQVFYELEGFKSIGEQLNNIKLLFFSVRHSSRIF